MTDPFLLIFQQLYRHYGPLNWWPAETPFEVCVGAILTQNTNWGNVEKAIANLKGLGLLSPEGIREIETERLAAAIRPAGYYNIKSQRLKEFVEWFFCHHGGKLGRMFAGPWQELRGELLKVRGIGRETCDAILLYAGHKPSFVVDAYTARLFGRLGLLNGASGYEAIRQRFMESLPGDAQLYNDYHALIVQQSKEWCRKKPCCTGCPLSDLCPRQW